MPDEKFPVNILHFSSCSAAQASKTPSTGTIRGRTSPTPGSSADHNGDGPRPTKRARKAINCEPCRNSKLKCDRGSCQTLILLGTSAMCYQDSRGHEGGDYSVRGDDHQRIDPAQEIARLRHSISLLEAYVFPTQRSYSAVRRGSEVAPVIPKKEMQGGTYAGPTSVATHLPADSRGSEDSDSRQASQDRNNDDLSTGMSHEYDRDLLGMLPSIDIIDGLINYYFEYCNWIYRHVDQVSFLLHNWGRYKKRILPGPHRSRHGHRLLEGCSETHEELGLKYFEVEEIWHAKSEIVSIGTAMGLHRDPGKWRMHRDVAERRRWAWWHIVLLERWQAFTFGRPITISSHHFDTQLPSYCDPSVDKSDIMDDAVSVRPVPYDSVQANDRALTQWMDNLPAELDLDEYRLARNLASSNLATPPPGVQSVIVRTSYYHIRFTLHRPYANASINSKMTSGELPKLITMTAQSRPDFITNTALAVPGHMNWGPFHCFSAAMFFSFQLIANPDQPGASLFRSSIRKAMATLEQARGSAVADKGYNILQSLAPLYSVEFPQQSPDIREKEKARILSVVRKLAFPYHDSHDPRRMGESPSGRGAASSPSNSNSVSPPMNGAHALPYHEGLHNLSSMRTAPPIYTTTQSPDGPMRSPQQTQMSPTVVSHPHYNSSYPSAIWGPAIGFGQSEWNQFLQITSVNPSSRDMGA
ncbi:hypothetical protein B0H14DRAFT_2720565 [Mycena olivaceomarginata]|nr:hypothetical protein B0H14DRAFT_2720565 [Mycena olivaceomarginata]